MYDVLIKGGRVVDPSQNIDGIYDVAIQGSRIASVEETIDPANAKSIVNAENLIVSPGLIDMHVHIYEGVSFFGVNADETCLAHGVTTVADAGCAGAYTFAGLRKFIIENSKTDILAFLSLSGIGLITRIGELVNVDYLDIDAARKTIEANRDVICGIKIRMEQRHLGDNALLALKLARELADSTRLPIMFHVGNTFPPFTDVLEYARAGDIITHCYHSRAGGILDNNNKLRPEVLRAFEKGVIFDVGHGLGSFSFQIARMAMEQGFFPHTIGSDLHVLNVGGPVFNLTTTMSKFLTLGLSLNKVIEMTTSNPAQVLQIYPRKGTLRPGSDADITLLQFQRGPITLTEGNLDPPVETIVADEYISAYGVVKKGEVLF